MSNHCTMCGVTIPDGQRVCSVCYGDPEYGRDGILREQMQQDAEAQYAHEQQQEEE